MSPGMVNTSSYAQSLVTAPGGAIRGRNLTGVNRKLALGMPVQHGQEGVNLAGKPLKHHRVSSLLGEGLSCFLSNQGVEMTIILWSRCHAVGPSEPHLHMLGDPWNGPRINDNGKGLSALGHEGWMKSPEHLLVQCPLGQHLASQREEHA